jgi:hypothetical protein
MVEAGEPLQLRHLLDAIVSGVPTPWIFTAH